MPEQNAIDTLKALAASRQQQRGRPQRQPAIASDAASGFDRLGSLLRGGGPLTDADLRNMESYPQEPMVEIEKRLLGKPIPANYGKDINLPVEEVSLPTRLLRALRQGIGL